MCRLSIIIVSWNVADLLEQCLASLFAHPVDGMEVIVVDSASADETVARVRARYPAVRLLPQAENVGFVRGNNIGLAAANGDYMLLLNPDTEIIGDALKTMLDYLETHPAVGVVGPQTFNTDGTHQSTRRRFPRRITPFFESTWLQPLAPRGVLDHYYAADIADDATAPVDWVQGSALLARREVYVQIGGLDPGYVMFSEEMDWCYRARQAGWEVVYLGTAHIIHHGGRSTDQAIARRHIHFNESKLRFHRKYHGATFAALLRLFLMAQFGWQMALEALKALVGHKAALRRERIRVYWQVLRSGLRVN